MHPELIKAELRMRGVTPAALADELEVSKATVSNVIHGRGISERIASRISSALGKPLSEIWPNRYGAAKTANLRRTRTAKAA